MKGRKPKPAALQIAEGDPSKRGTGKLEERLSREAKARTGLPAPPAHLKGRALDAWRRIAAELEHMDLDRQPDAAALEGVCVAYARAVEADEIIARDGLLVPHRRMAQSGEVVELDPKANPALAVSAKAWTQFRQFATEFGLTPVSRGRLALDKTAPRGEEDDLAALLSGPRPAREDPAVH